MLQINIITSKLSSSISKRPGFYSATKYILIPEDKHSNLYNSKNPLNKGIRLIHKLSCQLFLPLESKNQKPSFRFKRCKRLDNNTVVVKIHIY